MTQCKYRTKPVWHQTAHVHDGRAVVVAESPHNLLLRLKGTRMVMKLPWGIALVKAAQVEAAMARLRKANVRAAGGGKSNVKGGVS